MREHATALAATLRDGGEVVIRPLQPGEAGPLTEVFDGMSARSRGLRYLTGLPRLPSVMVSMLTDVDGDRHLAWLAEVDGAAAGIARAIRLPGAPTTAEVAFEVVDAQHGRGLATVLVDAVTTAASARGVRQLVASLDPDNRASRRLLDRLGLRGHVREGLLELSGPLHLMDPPAVDRAAVVRVACGAAVETRRDIG